MSTSTGRPQSGALRGVYHDSFRHKVLIVCNQRVRDESLPPADLDRLSSMADWEWLHMEGGIAFGPNEDPDAISQLIEHVGDVDCVVVSHGSPMISAEVMDGAPTSRSLASWRKTGSPTASTWRPPGSAASAPSIRPTVPPIQLPNGPLATSLQFACARGSELFGTRHQRGGIRGMPACGVLRLHSLESQPPPPFVSLEGCAHGTGYPRPM